jgi:hypothetical protein
LTLILFIPHSHGYVLVSDRQDTFTGTGAKTEVTKLYIQSKTGPAVGCSGSTSVIQNLYSKMTDKWINLSGKACDRIKSLYTEILGEAANVRRLTGSDIEADLEMLVIETDNGKIEPFYMFKTFERRISSTHIFAVPQNFPELQRYLGDPIPLSTEDDAIRLGEFILRQMVFSNYTIGPPEYHGYDVVRISETGEFLCSKVEPKIKREDFKLLLKHLHAKTEAKEETK